MAPLHKFFSSAFIALVYASVAIASPYPATNHATHRTLSIGKRGLELNVYHPTSTYETFGEGVFNPILRRPGTTLEQNAIAYVKEKLGVEADGITFKGGYSTDVASVAYIRQKHDGIEFANSMANIAFKGDRVVAFGSSFVKPTKIAPSQPKVALSDAIATAEEALNGRYNNHPAKIEYLLKEDGTAALTYVVQLENEAGFTWYEAFVDAETGELLSVNNFVNDATYRVLPSSREYPAEGFETLKDPEDLEASPKGWLNDGTISYTNTTGNNVIAYKGKIKNTSPVLKWFLYLHVEFQQRTRPRRCARERIPCCKYDSRHSIPLRIHREGLQLPTD